MAGEKRQITRSRISYSCQKCRQRKVKCDKVHPICGACQKTDEECFYTSNEPENQADNEPSVVEVNQGTKRKQPPSESQQDHTERNASINGAPELQNQLLRLSALLSRLGGIAGIAVADEAVTYHDILTPTSPRLRNENVPRAEFDQSRQARDSAPLNQIGGQQQGPNLDTISMQLEQLTNLLRAEQLGLLPKAVKRQSTFTSNESFPKSTAIENDVIMLFVPNEQQRNALFRSWLSSVYPVLPVVNPAVALMHYRTFHFWYHYGLEKGIPNPCEDHVPLIYAIYYSGVVSLSSRGFQKWFPGARRRQILQSLRKQFLQTLRVPSKYLSNPPTLAARIMMYYMSYDNKAAESTHSAVLLARTAYSCGLHRERPNESLDKHLAEARRRLWWEVAFVDTLEASACNVPPSINYHYSDTSLMSVIKDSKLDSPEAVQYERALQSGHASVVADELAKTDQSSMVSTIYLVMETRTTLACNIRHLLHINLATKPKTREDMLEIRKSLEELDGRINSVIRMIPAKGMPELNFTPQAKPGQSISLDHGNIYGEDLLSSEVDAICGDFSQSERWQMPFIQQYRPAMAAFHKWSRIMLSMSIDQAHCFSYAPFLSNAKSKVWMSARQCALKHAHSCLRKFNAIATDLHLERFRWTWPAMYHPTYACVIILLDTYERPMSREAPRSRALFDQMLYLSSPEYGIVGGEDGMTTMRPLQESGNEAFTMLMQLRAKAWHRAGLDPLLLWTEEDQIKVGVAKPLTDAERMAQSLREDVVFDGISSTQPDQNLLRPITEERAKEHFHPSFDLNEDDEVVTPRTCVERAETPPQIRGNEQRLLRAKPDQQRAPKTSDAPRDGPHDRSGHLYRFKLPSELYDIGELIRKIKGFQQSKRSGQNDNSTSLAEELTSANNDLTDFLSQKFPDNSGCCSVLANGQQQPAQSTDAPVSATTNQSLSSTQPPASRTAPTPVPNPQPQPKSHPPTLQPTINHQNPPPSTPMAAPTASTSTSNATNSTSTNPDLDLVNMDFDWEKWDEIFGHILDESFDNLSPVHDSETMDSDSTEMYLGQ